MFATRPIINRVYLKTFNDGDNSPYVSGSTDHF